MPSGTLTVRHEKTENQTVNAPPLAAERRVVTQEAPSLFCSLVCAFRPAAAAAAAAAVTAVRTPQYESI